MPGVPKQEKNKLCKATKKASGSEKNEALTYLLNKFNKDDILTSVIETPGDRTKKVLKKSNLIRDAINLLTEKFSDLDELILFLQLRYYLTQRKARYWNCLEIKDSKRFKQPDLSSEKVSYSIRKYFNKYGFPCKSYCEKQGDSIWTVLSLNGETQQPACFITQMKIPLIFYHSLKQKYLLIVQKVLRKTYRGTDIEEFPPIYSDVEYIQKLNTNAWKSLKLNVKKKFKTPLGDNNFQTQDVNKNNRKAVNAQNEIVTLNEKENRSLNEPQSKFESSKKKEVPPCDLQSNLVTHNAKKKKKASKEPQRKFVGSNKNEVPSNDLQSNLVTHVRKVNKVSNKPQNKFVGDNEREVDLGDLQSSLVTHNVNKENEISTEAQTNFVVNNARIEHNNFQSNFQSCNAKKTNVVDEPQTNFIGDDNANKSSDEFQSKTMKQNLKKHIVPKKLQRNFNSKNKQQEEPSVNLKTNLITCKVKRKSKTVNKLQPNFVDSSAREESFDNLQCNFRTLDAKKKSKIVNKPQTNFIDENVGEDSSDDLQSNFRIHSAKKKNNANEPQTIAVDNITEGSSNFQSSMVAKNLDQSCINFKNNNINEGSADDSENHFVTLTKFQSTYVIHNWREEDNLQNFIVPNMKGKNITLNEPQTHLVGHNLDEEPPVDLHNKLASHNGMQKIGPLNEFQNFVQDNVKKKEKSIKELENNFKTCNMRKDIRISNKLKYDHRTKEKTKDKNVLSSNTDTMPNMCYNRTSRRLKKKLTGELFDEADLPPIKKLEYCVKSNEFGIKNNASSVCVVTFKGTNILKGLQKLVDSGIAEPSLPDYLCEEPKTGKSEYVINM